MRRDVIFAAILLSVLCEGARAASQLIPTPYPQMLGRNAMEQQSVILPHDHSLLLDDPAPAAKGLNALGNPHLSHHTHHHPRVPYPRQWWPRGYAE